VRLSSISSVGLTGARFSSNEHVERVQHILFVERNVNRKFHKMFSVNSDALVTLTEAQGDECVLRAANFQRERAADDAVRLVCGVHVRGVSPARRPPIGKRDSLRSPCAVATRLCQAVSLRPSANAQF